MTPHPVRAAVSVPALGARLFEEHARLHRVFADMMQRAESGDYRLCDEVWDEFAADLERHLRFEEAELFPRFAATGESASAEVAHLAGEHETIRRRVFELGVGLQTRTMRGQDVAALLSDLDAHAARENTILYPWATEAYRPHASPDEAAGRSPASLLEKH